jgi:hypothetical protein
MYGRRPEAADLEHNDTCIVCMEAMVAKGAIKLVCSHCVHRDCLHQWNLRRQTCPVCRLNLPATYEAIDEAVKRERAETGDDT